MLLLKEVGSARLREIDIHPISMKTPAPQYEIIDRKKRKEKKAEDNKSLLWPRASQWRIYYHRMWVLQ